MPTSMANVLLSGLEHLLFCLIYLRLLNSVRLLCPLQTMLTTVCPLLKISVKNGSSRYRTFEVYLTMQAYPYCTLHTFQSCPERHFG